MTDASFYGSAYTQAGGNRQHMSGITVPQKGSGQTDLSTKAAQHKHYAAIHARLMMARADLQSLPPAVARKRIIHVARGLPMIVVGRCLLGSCQRSSCELPPPLFPDAVVNVVEAIPTDEPLTSGHAQIGQIKRIQYVTADHFRVGIRHILSPSRLSHITHARQIGMYLCRHLMGKSFPEIGRRFGGKDHTTVLHAFKKIEQLRQHDPELASDLAAIEDRLAFVQ